MASHEFPGALTEEHVLAIGLVTTEWTRIENQSQILLWQLLGLEPRIGRCITQHVSFVGLWDSIFALLTELSSAKEDINLAKSIYTKINVLRTERNNIVHAHWSMSPYSSGAKPGEATAITIKARGTLNINHRNIPADEIHSLYKSIGAAGLELANFGQSIIGKYNGKKS